MSKIVSSIKGGLTTVALASLMVVSHAAPISISAQLTGDARVANPDNLIVDVTITGDTTSNVVSWKFDINSPLHPNAKLDEFYFNMLGLGSDYSFSGFSPLNWSVATPASTAGGGGISFLFEALDPPPGPPQDVTNGIDLLFTMTKLTGNFTIADFLSAGSSCSNDLVLGCGQLGAHLQSLTQGTGNTTDSGFALGNYSSSSTSTSSTTGGTSGNIPEPSSSGLVFLGLGLVAASFWTRRHANS